MVPLLCFLGGCCWIVPQLKWVAALAAKALTAANANDAIVICILYSRFEGWHIMPPRRQLAVFYPSNCVHIFP